MQYNHQTKTITTDRLILRLFQKSDAVSVARLCNNYNVFKSTLYLPYPDFVSDALTWIDGHLKNFNENRSYEFAITRKVDGELLGAVALSHHQRFNHGELGYWIGEEFWGNGYATEAAQAMVAFAFHEKGYHRVFARFFQTNPASGRVLQKIGMKQEGIFIDEVLKEDRYINVVYYAIVHNRKE